MLDRREVILGLAVAGISTTSAPLEAKYVNERIKDAGYAVPGTRWLLGTFGEAIKAQASGTPFSYQLLCAIAYQESGYFWWRKKFLAGKSPEQVLRLIVLDDVTRGAGTFPPNTRTFLADPRYADISANLISASDAARVEQGYKPNGKLRFGYGLFQNDLQNIESHPEFWTTSLPSSPDVKGLWGDISACTSYCLRELQGKYEAVGHDVYRAVRAYNGSGTSADVYLDNVRVYERAITQAGL